jgi:hypothetical protein
MADDLENAFRRADTMPATTRRWDSLFSMAAVAAR